jgi:hypothetical protein
MVARCSPTCSCSCSCTVSSYSASGLPSSSSRRVTTNWSSASLSRSSNHACSSQIEGCRSYVSSVTTVLQISIGSWDWDSIYEGGPIAILHFIAYAVIGTIMLLNLLIAVRPASYLKQLPGTNRSGCSLSSSRCLGTPTTRSGKTACCSLRSNGLVKSDMMPSLLIEWTSSHLSVVHADRPRRLSRFSRRLTTMSTTTSSGASGCTRWRMTRPSRVSRSRSSNPLVTATRRGPRRPGSPRGSYVSRTSRTRRRAAPCRCAPRRRPA